MNDIVGLVRPVVKCRRIEIRAVRPNQGFVSGSRRTRLNIAKSRSGPNSRPAKGAELVNVAQFPQMVPVRQPADVVVFDVQWDE